MVFFINAYFVFFFFLLFLSFLNLFVFHLISALWHLFDLLSSLSISLVHEKLTLSHCRHTISAARACFLDNDLGSLSPGKLADFVVLSTDSWNDFAAEGSASVEATYVAGVRAYPWKLSSLVNWSTEIDTIEKGIAPGWILLGIKLWYVAAFIMETKDMSCRKQSLDTISEDIFSVSDCSKMFVWFPCRYNINGYVNEILDLLLLTSGRFKSQFFFCMSMQLAHAQELWILMPISLYKMISFLINQAW